MALVEARPGLWGWLSARQGDDRLQRRRRRGARPRPAAGRQAGRRRGGQDVALWRLRPRPLPRLASKGVGRRRNRRESTGRLGGSGAARPALHPRHGEAGLTMTAYASVARDGRRTPWLHKSNPRHRRRDSDGLVVDHSCRAAAGRRLPRSRSPRGRRTVVTLTGGFSDANFRPGVIDRCHFDPARALARRGLFCIQS